MPHGVATTTHERRDKSSATRLPGAAVARGSRLLTPLREALREQLIKRRWVLVVPVGVWQVPGFVKRGQPWDGHAAVRRMEAWTRKHRGYQCLYAVTEQTESEFWRMFDPKLYARMRTAYGAHGAFLDVFAKVRRMDAEAISTST